MTLGLAIDCLAHCCPYYHESLFPPDGWEGPAHRNRGSAWSLGEAERSQGEKSCLDVIRLLHPCPLSPDPKPSSKRPGQTPSGWSGVLPRAPAT